uniref:Uncharacterized protein n=1 Tax=Plectus sambesii TaxID=2011161 RepID=A0A914VVN4_9BILA
MGSSSGSAMPTSQHRPNNSRSNFKTDNPFTGVKPKVKEDAFADLLRSDDFPVIPRNPAYQSLDDMKRVGEIKDVDPVSIRIRDWTKGKERNIRALLGSLKDVLWEGAD